MKILIGIVALLLLAAGLPAAQTIVVTAPNGGETLTLGQTAHITWTASGVSQNVKLQLLASNGTQVGVIAKDLAPASGAYAWTVGQYSGGTAAAGSYKVRVRTMDNAVEDVSNAVFTIAAATGSTTIHLQYQPGDPLQPQGPPQGISQARPQPKPVRIDRMEPAKLVALTMFDNFGHATVYGQGFGASQAGESAAYSYELVYRNPSGGVPVPFTIVNWSDGKIIFHYNEFLTAGAYEVFICRFRDNQPVGGPIGNKLPVTVDPAPELD